ncbi:MAG: TetR/AcrR family transcriptional regulator [Chloroflexota bacterium]
MARKTKRDWFMAGLELLTELGSGSVKIDYLTKRLGVTKGSFYHHFNNHQDYKTQLLDFIMEEGTLQIIELTNQAETPEGKLNKLLEVTSGHPPTLEIALRAWALQDPEVRHHQTTIDQQRIAYVQDIFTEMGHDTPQALQMARVLYAVYIGCHQILPPIQKEDLEDCYLTVMPLFVRKQ